MSPESQPVKQRRLGQASLLVTVCVLATLLSACGRRGALEPPPGTAERAKATTSDLSGSSTAGGSPTFRPARETDIGQADVLSGEAPPVPALAEQQQFDNTRQNASTASSATAAGLRTRSTTTRTSPPPKTPFILDSLL